MSEARSLPLVGRATASATVVLAAALVCGRLFATCVDRVVPAHSKFTLSQLRRSSAIIDAASAPLGDAAIIGSSSMRVGFDPRPFDAALAARGHHFTTLSLAVVPNTPTLAGVLASRMCEAHRANGTHWKLLVYHLEWQAWIREFVDMHSSDPSLPAFDRAIRAMTLTPAALFDAFVHDPNEAASLLAGRVIGPRAPFAVADAVKNYIYQDLFPSTWQDGVPPERLEQMLVWWRFMDGYSGPDWTGWDDEARGFDPVRARDVAAYEQVVRDNFAEALTKEDREDPQYKWMVSMNISAPDVTRSIALARELGQCADRVVLVLPPLAPRLLADMAPEARQRLADAVSRIQRETGYPVADLLVVPGLPPTEFQDAFHVTITNGSQVFSKALGERVAEILERQP